jgi:hypothetical protein
MHPCRQPGRHVDLRHPQAVALEPRIAIEDEGRGRVRVLKRELNACKPTFQFLSHRFVASASFVLSFLDELSG